MFASHARAMIYLGRYGSCRAPRLGLCTALSLPLGPVTRLCYPRRSGRSLASTISDGPQAGLDQPLPRRRPSRSGGNELSSAPGPPAPPRPGAAPSRCVPAAALMTPIWADKRSVAARRGHRSEGRPSVPPTGWPVPPPSRLAERGGVRLRGMWARAGGEYGYGWAAAGASGPVTDGWCRTVSPALGWAGWPRRSAWPLRVSPGRSPRHAPGARSTEVGGSPGV